LIRSLTYIRQPVCCNARSMTLAIVTTPGEGESISEITLHLTEPAMHSPDQVPSSGRGEDEWNVAFEFATAESKRFLAILQERPVVRRLLTYARNLKGTFCSATRRYTRRASHRRPARRPA
jgi:hypothetical protein